MSKIKDIIERAEELADEMLKGLEGQLEGMEYGTSEPNTEQIRQFFEMQMQRYPPALYFRIDPDTGEVETRFDSPWMIALREKNCRGGEAVARRIERALQ